MKKNKLQRGDLYYYDFGKREGSIQSGIRPVLIVQADEFNANAPTIIVASITTVLKKKYLPSHIIIGKEFGLSKPSMVLLEQIQTINFEQIMELYNNTKKDIEFKESKIEPLKYLDKAKLTEMQRKRLTNNTQGFLAVFDGNVRLIAAKFTIHNPWNLGIGNDL